MAKLPENLLKKKEADLRDLKDRESVYINPVDMLVRSDGECFINQDCKYSNTSCDLMILRVTKLCKDCYVACVDQIDYKWEKQSLRFSQELCANYYGEVVDFVETSIDEILAYTDNIRPFEMQYVTLLERKKVQAVKAKNYELGARIREAIYHIKKG